MTSHLANAPMTRRRAISVGSAAGAALLAAAGFRESTRAGTDATPEAGTSTTGGTPGATPAAGTPAADDATSILVRVEIGGGFVTPAANLVNAPIYQLTNDGREITQGPQILIYPPPALPNFQVATLTDSGTQTILDAAAAAGLVGQDQQYRNDQVADQPTTRITVVADGVTAVTEAYGLDMLEPGTTGELADARDRIQAFLAALQNPPSMRSPAEVAVPESAYIEEQLQVVMVPAEAILPPPEPDAVQGSEPQQPYEWPLETPITDLGMPLVEANGGENYDGLFPGARVATLSGADREAVRAQAETANQESTWLDNDQEWVLLFRPVLPGELINLARPDLSAGSEG
ncbi:MAG TPA: hypothetical protein VGT61_03040 [Thermomicrobiales bacterium]|jgi:hypothetical protein|nr:hypothetical protein [Thermomicrobiales bacterium]